MIDKNGEDYVYKKENVKGYEEYSVDTNGIVYGKKGNPLKYSLNHRGYCMIVFLVDGIKKGFAIHTIVAKQFIDNPEPLVRTQVNHKDGNKQNNCVDNLEWVTPKENVRHCIEVLGFDNTGINNCKHKKIQGRDYKTSKITYIFNSLADAGKYFCEDNHNFRYVQNSIYRALRGIRKTYKNCIWEYID